MYTRRANGRELEFGVSGKLYKDALVMYDRQTDSLWTQVDGSVLRGPMEGARLERVPAVQTTWAEWKRLHPDTLVLIQPRDAKGSPYAGYFRSPDKMGIAGTENPDDRLPGKALVVTLREGEDAVAIPLGALQQTPFFQTEIAGLPVVVTYNRRSSTARVFDRRLDGQALDFFVADQGQVILLRDRRTGTHWSGLTGEAVEGELKGRKLEPVPHMVNYWFAWAAYNPRTRVEKP